MSDTELLDFIDDNGVQCWPDREHKSGVILRWTVQVLTPWIQVTRGTLRLALWDAKEKFEETR